MAVRCWLSAICFDTIDHLSDIENPVSPFLTEEGSKPVTWLQGVTETYLYAMTTSLGQLQPVNIVS
jgi:hypothetical protein